MPAPSPNPSLKKSSAKLKWQFFFAAAVSLVGAALGGIFGSFIAAFAGDSWWTSRFALSCFQHAMAIGGGCVGAVPGMIWLFCLGQKWVLPFLFAAAGALLLPIFERMPISNTTLGLSYAGTLVFGFLAGGSLWIFKRRAAKS